MIWNILLFALIAALSGFLYYVGGCSKEEGHKKIPFLPLWVFDTHARDVGCAILGCLALWLLYGLHWSLVLTFGAFWGALSTYHKWLNKFFGKTKEDCHWFNWLAHGLCLGLAVTPYVYFYQHNYIGLALLIGVLGFTTMLWSEKQDKVEIEASGRGVLIILSLLLLNPLIVTGVLTSLVTVLVIKKRKSILKLVKKLIPQKPAVKK